VNQGRAASEKLEAFAPLGFLGHWSISERSKVIRREIRKSRKRIISSTNSIASVAFLTTDDSDKTSRGLPSSDHKVPGSKPIKRDPKEGHVPRPRAGAAGHHHVSSISGRNPKPETRLSVASSGILSNDRRPATEWDTGLTLRRHRVQDFKITRTTHIYKRHLSLDKTSLRSPLGHFACPLLNKTSTKGPRTKRSVHPLRSTHLPSNARSEPPFALPPRFRTRIIVS
jgi:hypothetical protein